MAELDWKNTRYRASTVEISDYTRELPSPMVQLQLDLFRRDAGSASAGQILNLLGVGAQNALHTVSVDAEEALIPTEGEDISSSYDRAAVWAKSLFPEYSLSVGNLNGPGDVDFFASLMLYKPWTLVNASMTRGIRYPTDCIHNLTTLQLGMSHLGHDLQIVFDPNRLHPSGYMQINGVAGQQVEPDGPHAVYKTEPRKDVPDYLQRHRESATRALGMYVDKSELATWPIDRESALTVWTGFDPAIFYWTDIFRLSFVRYSGAEMQGTDVTDGLLEEFLTINRSFQQIAAANGKVKPGQIYGPVAANLARLSQRMPTRLPFTPADFLG